MARRRNPRRDDGDRDERRGRRRYSKQTNWTGIVAFFAVLGLLGVVAIILAKRMGQEEDWFGGPPSDVDGGQPATTPQGGKPSGAGDPEVDPDHVDPDHVVPDYVVPDRPAPEYESEAVQHADALFRAAKSLFARAEIAEEEGENDECSALMNDCREKFRELHAYLKIYTTWLAEAKRGKWPIPKVYNTLEKRVAKYGKFEARVPQKAP